MVHLLAMRQLVHHDHLHHALRQPSPTPVPQHQLYDFSGVEIAPDELGVVGEFFEGLDEDHVGFHEGVAYCGDSVQDLFGDGGGRAWERADEVYEGVWALGSLVEALEAEGHRGEMSPTVGQGARVGVLW